MPNKKNKNSRYTGFYWYMQELMPQLKKTGRVFGGIDQVVPVARPMWKAMTKQEQDKYERIAKEMKRKEQNELFGLPKYRDDSQRLDNMGNIIADRVDGNEVRRNDRLRDRKRARAKWPIEKEDMLDVKFYFIAFEYLCVLEEGDYLPCEVSLLEWSMRNGITKTFHKFIDSGGIPMGYRFSCQQHSEETHQIPIERFELSDGNYKEIWMQMENFVNPNGEARDFPPLYCAETEWKGCISMTSWLYLQACTPHQNCLSDIFVLEDCVQDIAAKAGHSVAEGQLGDLLLTSVYDYEANTRCKWHEKNEVKNCALGTVKRYAYTMSDFFSDEAQYNFELTMRHLPIRDERYNNQFLPANRVHMAGNKKEGGAYSALKNEGRSAAIRQNGQDNGIFPARDVRYKENRVVIDLDEDDEEDDLESMYSYSSKQTSVSNFSVDKPRTDLMSNPYYKPNIMDEEDFPSLGGDGPKSSFRQSIPTGPVNSDGDGIKSWHPSSAYLEERSKREEAISNQPSLMDIVKVKASQQQSNQDTMLPGGVRMPETMPAVGRGFGRGIKSSSSGSNPWLQQQSSQVMPERQKSSNPWAQGAKRGEPVVGEQKEVRNIKSFAGVGRGRGAWVPRAEPMTINQEASVKNESLPVTRPPPGFGRGYLKQQMAGMTLND